MVDGLLASILMICPCVFLLIKIQHDLKVPHSMTKAVLELVQKGLLALQEDMRHLHLKFLYCMERAN